jgi:hypothetical protein
MPFPSRFDFGTQSEGLPPALLSVHKKGRRRNEAAFAKQNALADFFDDRPVGTMAACRRAVDL